MTRAAARAMMAGSTARRLEPVASRGRQWQQKVVHGRQLSKAEAAAGDSSLTREKEGAARLRRPG
jgi:hypothetical protein